MEKTFIDQVKEFFTLKVVLIILACIAGLFILGWLFSGASGWWDSRGIAKKQEAVNAGLANVANIETKIERGEGNVANLREQQAAEKQNVNALTQDLLEAKEADQAQRWAVNQALKDLDAAKNSNATNVSVQDLEEKLKGL